MNDVDALALTKEDLFLALCEAYRWWLTFDGPQTRIVLKKPEPGLLISDVKNIALTYNFIRNLSGKNRDHTYVADRINEFRGQTWTSFDARAADIESAVNAIYANTSGKHRLVSGTTKLSWFVAPDNWTPFDRLAAQAVKAKSQDTVKRMRQFYSILDDMNFLDRAKAINGHLSNTMFAELGGCRVLDKYLMLKGDDTWALDVKNFAKAFANSLPDTMKTEIFSVGKQILNDQDCQLDIGAL